MPDFAWELRLGGLVAGIDEAGRGPLAGPVVAAAVIFPHCDLPLGLDGLDDSKRLSAARREHYAAILATEARRGAIALGVGAASAAEIDHLNILQATFLAMRRAVAALRCGAQAATPDVVLVDGNRLPPGLTVAGHAVIGGDAICLSIAAASVIAKTVRDRIMDRLSPRYAAYGWDSNAGYGTRVHLLALESHGATRHHRRSFAPVARLPGI